MRKRRFPRKPIDPVFKVAIAFGLPIDLVIGMKPGNTYAPSIVADHVGLRWFDVIKVVGQHASSLTLTPEEAPDWTLS